MPIDYRKYPHDWFTRIIPAVLARANNCCEHCGRKNKDVVYSYPSIRWKNGKKVLRQIWQSEPSAGSHKKGKFVRVILTVAHLDHDEWNHQVELNRLLAMCQKCHLEYDAKVHSIRRQHGQLCQYPNCHIDQCPFH